MRLIVNGDLGGEDFPWASAIVCPVVAQVRHGSALAFCHPRVERHF